MMTHCKDSLDSNGNVMREAEFGHYSKFTYDGQTTCLPFFPFFVDFPSLAVVSCQQQNSNRSKITGLNPAAMVSKTVKQKL